MYMYITEFFYGNAGTANYAACSNLSKRHAGSISLPFMTIVSIGKKEKKSVVSHYSDASVIVLKITEIKRVRYSRYRL